MNDSSPLILLNSLQNCLYLTFTRIATTSRDFLMLQAIGHLHPTKGISLTATSAINMTNFRVFGDQSLG